MGASRRQSNLVRVLPVNEEDKPSASKDENESCSALRLNLWTAMSWSEYWTFWEEVRRRKLNMWRISGTVWIIIWMLRISFEWYIIPGHLMSRTANTICCALASTCILSTYLYDKKLYIQYYLFWCIQVVSVTWWSSRQLGSIHWQIFDIYLSIHVIILTMGCYEHYLIFALLSIECGGFGMIIRNSPAVEMTVRNVMLAFTVHTFGYIYIYFIEQNRKRDYLNRKKLAEETESVRMETRLSNDLLLNILPAKISEQIQGKPDEESLVRTHDDATCLQADLVGFTKMSSRHSAAEIVILINELFCTFDELADKYGMEKVWEEIPIHLTLQIKTVGDAYIAVGNINIPNPDHRRAALEMALDLTQVKALTQNRLGETLQLRVGISSGTCITGKSGCHRWHYDAFGPAKIRSEILEACGVANHVLMDVDTWSKIDRQDKFRHQVVKIDDDKMKEGVLISGRHRATSRIDSDCHGGWLDVQLSPHDDDTMISREIESDCPLNLMGGLSSPQMADQCWEQQRPENDMNLIIHSLGVFFITFILFVYDAIMFTSVASVSFSSTLVLHGAIAFFVSPVDMNTIVRLGAISVWIIMTAAIPWLAALVYLTIFGLCISITSVLWGGQIRVEILHPDTAVAYGALLGVCWMKYFLNKADSQRFFLKRLIDERRIVAAQAKEKTDQLAHNIMPSRIFHQLGSLSTIAEHYEEVGCLFIGTLPQGMQMDNEFILEKHHQLSVHIDRFLRNRPEFEKIKQINGVYFIVNHVISLVSLAKMILSKLPEWTDDIGVCFANSKAGYSGGCHARAGISLGPCTGGIVGRNKFAYDLWGDSINVASRMQAMCLPGKIQVTQQVAERVKDVYQIAKRGVVQVKGKEEMTTYWIEGLNPQAELNTPRK
ncbi:adenylate cyclase type 1-like [Planoprotostelium fungivorum]|uniref:adenylate cyclase n=1 Tax=Planoprotostelium fungivorum TaxID=1890364 RepID=A0A2P6NJC2_9EUKA|nr:adenylate cyclase type 1-like [Planoprotostelium fungivorum]